jgi:hypothetical protein
MVDYSINRDFDIYFNEWGDFVTVDGLAEFEQDVVIQLHDNLESVISGSNSENAEEKITLEVARVARQFDVIDSIKNIDVSRSFEGRGTYEVLVTYNTGDTFVEEL